MSGAAEPVEHVDVLIVGAGISGIGAAWHLQHRSPNRTFAILEGRDDLGGTWSLFRYPGIRSDSDMHTLGYEFRPWIADKAIAENSSSDMPNPALGLRAIRFCLAEPQMFLEQLRAMLRASHYGKLKILIPMLMSLPEITQALAYVEIAKKSLADRFIPFDRDVEVGGMIEIPAAALAINTFIEKLDFLSIGTNDLIQYTLAIDRSDDAVSHLYDPLHPAVINLIAQVIKACNKAGIPVALCGEMAGDVQLTRLLLGLGLRQFSMHPASLLEVKQQVLKSNLREIAPTMYLNVPRGYALMLDYFERDAALRDRFFGDLEFIFYAGAAMAESLQERIRRLAEQVKGEPVPLVSAWGATETAPQATGVNYANKVPSCIGLPSPGVEIKLAPVGEIGRAHV